MPLLWISIAFVVGILLGKWVSFSWVWWTVILIVGFLVSISDQYINNKFSRCQYLRSKMPVIPGVLFIFLALGGLRFELSQPSWDQNDLAWYNDKGEYIITAWVSAPPDRREDMVVLQMTAVELFDPANPDWVNAAHKVTGVAQVRLPANTHWQYGDMLQFSASPHTPSENKDFSYREYLAGQNVFSVIYYPQQVQQVGSNQGNAFRLLLINIREKALQTIFSIFPQPESGLLAGILLGMDNDLPETLEQAYRDTGTSHIIAISGFNMAVIASLTLWFFSRFSSKFLSALITGAILVIYTLFVDGSASVIRAALMAIMAFGGHLIGRKQEGLNALFFIGAVMCLFNPLLLWDISFQLSFSATFGLITLSQPMQTHSLAFLSRFLPEKVVERVINPINEYLLFTLAAQVTTLPVIAFHFGRISLSSILANPLVIPFQPLILIFGGASTLMGMIFSPLGRLLGMLIWPLLAYTNHMVQWLSKIKGGVLTIQSSFLVWFIVIFLVFLLAYFLRNYFKKILGVKNLIWLYLLLICGSITVWSAYLQRPDGYLHVSSINTGEDSSLYIQTPQGRVLIFNPHGSMNELSSALGQTLSPWKYQVDDVLLSDRESAAELAELSERIPVSEVLLAPSIYRSNKGEYPVVVPDSIKAIPLSPHQEVKFDSGVSLILLSENASGIALLLEYGSTTVLIPNGVDYALIKEEYPQAMQEVSALVLRPEDIESIPIRVWQQLDASLILWDSPTLSPFMDSTTAFNSFLSDGNTVFLQEE